MSMDLGDQAVQVTFKAADLTLDILKALVPALREYAQQSAENFMQQTFGGFSSRGWQTEGVPLSEDEFKDFKRDMKNHGVDVGIQNDLKAGECHVFFKAPDIGKVYEGFEKYAQGQGESSSQKRPMKEVFEQASQKSVQRVAAERQAPQLEQVIGQGEKVRARGLEP